MTIAPHESLPPQQQRAQKKAIFWACFTIGYTTMTVTVVALVVGNSQAMRTAWIEDMLSVIPQVSFLFALLFARRPATRNFPFGMHRIMGIGHLAGGVALLAVGSNLAVSAFTGLVAGERPTIGTIRLFGHTVWLGWVMVIVMTVIVVGPFIYGPAKLRLAAQLHNKLLFADADMARADWQTNAASIVGVLGVGLGLWWLDGAAALFISIGIVRDGVRNTRFAVSDLLDERARTFDDAKPHPLIGEILRTMRLQPWVRDVGVRMRDQGQVFQVEIFVVPKRKVPPRIRVLERVAHRISALDWKLHDVVIVPVARIPEHASREPRSGSR